MIYMNLSSTVSFDYNISISTSQVLYYIEISDIIGHSLDIGSIEHPILIFTGLFDMSTETTSTTYVSSTYISSSFIYSAPEYSSSTSSENSTDGTWYTRSSPPNTSPFPNIFIFSLSGLFILVLKRHR